MTEVTAQNSRRRGLIRTRGARFTTLIIRALRDPRGGGCRHCAGGAEADGTLMSHYFFGRALAVTATGSVATLSRRMMQRAAARALVSRRRRSQGVAPAQPRTPRSAVTLTALTRTAYPHGSTAPLAAEEPKALAHLAPRKDAGQRHGQAGIKLLRSAPLWPRMSRARGRTGNRNPGLRLSARPKHNEHAATLPRGGVS